MFRNKTSTDRPPQLGARDIDFSGGDLDDDDVDGDDVDDDAGEAQVPGQLHRLKSELDRVNCANSALTAVQNGEK